MYFRAESHHFPVEVIAPQATKSSAPACLFASPRTILPTWNPITLASLADKPSWHNRAGRVDRSACTVLPASRIWRRTEFIRNPTFQGRTAISSYKLTAYDLHMIMRISQPRPVGGDFRTSKSNAMQPERRLIPTPHCLSPNPNRGATRTKMLCLPADWSQTLTIERWTFPKNSKKTPRALAVIRSANRPNTSATRTQHFLICPTCKAKFVKLYLPQCTPREAEDSAIAQAYLARRRARAGNAPGDAHEAQFIERYGILFHPRNLQCRHCLGIRYGQVREAKT